MKKRFLTFILCLAMPLAFVGCENLNKDYLSTPQNLVVQTDGKITFERISNDEYYVININGLEQNVFVANKNPYIELFNKDGTNYLQYDISRLLNLGESYSIKVKACAKNKKDSDYTSAISYVHRMHVETPETMITGTTLTWNNVYNASSYLVKVVTPSTVVEADDPDTIANANVFSSQYTSNKFDFSSMLTEAGEYKFYVKAISRDNNYIESSFSPKVVYSNYLTLQTPSGLALHKDADNWILSCVVDANANSLKISLNDQTTLVDLLDSSVEKDEVCENLIYVNLNQAFRNNSIDFSTLKYAKVNCQATFETQAQNFYTFSAVSSNVVLNLTNRLAAPQLTLSADNILKWDKVEEDAVAGYKVYIFKANQVETTALTSDIFSIQLPSDYLAVAVQTLGYNGVENSVLSRFTTNPLCQSTTIEASPEGDSIVWTEVKDAYYVVETNNEIRFLDTNQFKILSVDYLITEFNVTAIAEQTVSNTIQMTPIYRIGLPYPENVGFVSSNKYLLSFDPVEKAIGYKVYVTDLSQESNQAVCIPKIFAENRIDLSSYVTRGKEYRVQVQAVADKYGYYLDSDLSSKDLILSYSQILDMPQFAFDNLGNPITITTDGSRKYFLNFYGVDGAYRYEIMVNFNTKTVLNDNRSTAYSVDITDYLTDINGEVMANAYNITLRALPQENDTITQSSKFNTYVYKLRNQLKQVTNIQVSNPDDTDGRYILSFDLQDNAQNYSIDIVKLNDTEYVSYLASLTPKLTLPITNVKGAFDITDYVQQAGEYYIYVTAHPGDDNSYYDSSDRSSEYAIVSKLQNLKTPFDLKYANQSSTEFYIGWDGDENTDIYNIKISTPSGKEYSRKTTNKLININDIITVEGEYRFSVKAVVASNGESSKTYISSPYSSEFSFVYRYTMLQDFERYGVYLFDQSTRYDYAIDDVTELTNLLWYHLVYGVDSNYKLNIYIKTSENQTTKQAIINLAEQASNYSSTNGVGFIYNFENDTTWQNMLSNTTSSESALLAYLCKSLLSAYPELAIVDGFECTATANHIFSLNYTNKLDDAKEFNTNYRKVMTDYANTYSYINKALRRNVNGVFAIDNNKEMNVETTEQLFMAVQYGFKPVFVGDCAVAQKVYDNAKLVLTAIVSANMTDLEKTNAIFSWLEFAFNINLDAKKITKGAVDVEGEISDWGNRAEFYLEGLLYNIGMNANGDIVIGNDQATDESLTKAFVLLCGIEGIETRKINGVLTYKDSASAKATDHTHSWNKVYLSAMDDGLLSWYNVDLTYSDLRYNAWNLNNSYNMSSHLFFLVSDSYLQSNLNMGDNTNPVKITNISENYIATMPTNKIIGKITNGYDYYLNTFKTVSYSDLQNVVRQAYLQPSKDANQAEEANSTFGLKYDPDADYRQYLAGEYVKDKDLSQGASGKDISHLQSYILNMLIYGKTLLKSGNSGRSSFELQIDENDQYDLGIYVVSQLNSLTERFINNTYKKDDDKFVSVNSFTTFDKASNTTTIIVTMAYSN